MLLIVDFLQITHFGVWVIFLWQSIFHSQVGCFLYEKIIPYFRIWQTIISSAQFRVIFLNLYLIPFVCNRTLSRTKVKYLGYLLPNKPMMIMSQDSLLTWLTSILYWPNILTCCSFATTIVAMTKHSVVDTCAALHWYSQGLLKIWTEHSILFFRNV